MWVIGFKCSFLFLVLIPPQDPESFDLGKRCLMQTPPVPRLSQNSLASLETCFHIPYYQRSSPFPHF